MAAAPNNPPIAGLGTAQPSLYYYRDYFSDPRTDVFQGNYAAALQPYGVPLANQNVPTPQGEHHIPSPRAIHPISI